MSQTLRLFRVVAFAILALALAPSAFAWGCKGHQAIALIAESRMTHHAREAALAILSASPVDPSLPRYCGPSEDPFADASTWPDDIRKLRPETSPWHFIDIPRGAGKSDIAKFCPEAQGCVTSALTEQIRVLRDKSASPQARADALRFVIHFVGDIHQPLHGSTNNDLGGNCVPVTFFGRAPSESAPGSGYFSPNLHGIWDVDILEHSLPGESSAQIANDLKRKYGAQMEAWQKQPIDFSAWAWESHERAETTAYGKLPHPIAIEAPHPMTACVENGDTAAHDRMLKIDENLSDSYENAAAPVVQRRVAQAGARLAAVLNSALR